LLQGGLVVFDRNQIVAVAREDGRAQVALGERGVAGDQHAVEDHAPNQLERGLVLVRLAVDRLLGDDAAEQGVEERNQMHSRQLSGAAPAEGLSVEGEAPTPVAHRRHPTDPRGESILEGLDVEPRHESAERPQPRNATEAELAEQLPADIATPLQNRPQTSTVRQHRGADEREQRSNRIPLPLTATMITHALERFHQRRFLRSLLGHGPSGSFGLRGIRLFRPPT